MFRLRRKKNQKIRTALIEAEGLILETQVKLASNSLNDKPMLEKHYKRFLEFYEDYSQRKDKVLKLSVLFALLHKFDHDEDKIEFGILQNEINTNIDKRVVELFVVHVNLVSRLLKISAPWKLKICMGIIDLRVKVSILKKNKEWQNLKNLEKDLVKINNFEEVGAIMYELKSIASGGI